MTPQATKILIERTKQNTKRRWDDLNAEIEDFNKKLTVMTAFVAGVPCQIKKHDGVWVDLDNPAWACKAERYRVAPPKPREFWILDDHNPYPLDHVWRILTTPPGPVMAEYYIKVVEVLDG